MSEHLSSVVFSPNAPYELTTPTTVAERARAGFLRDVLETAIRAAGRNGIDLAAEFHEEESLFVGAFRAITKLQHEIRAKGEQTCPDALNAYDAIEQIFTVARLMLEQAETAMLDMANMELGQRYNTLNVYEKLSQMQILVDGKLLNVDGFAVIEGRVEHLQNRKAGAACTNALKRAKDEQNELAYRGQARNWYLEELQTAAAAGVHFFKKQALESVWRRFGAEERALASGLRKNSPEFNDYVRKAEPTMDQIEGAYRKEKWGRSKPTDALRA